MAKKVRTIPATLNRFNSEPVTAVRKRRVAGYARVSTDLEEQATSYEAQMTYYRGYIESREDWEFAGMYSDEGITATNTKKRTGFNLMIGDALSNRKPRFIHMNLSRLPSRVVTSIPLTVTQQRRKVQRAAIVRVLFTRYQRMENLQCFGTV